jgi:hypothetical protein
MKRFMIPAIVALMVAALFIFYQTTSHTKVTTTVKQLSPTETFLAFDKAARKNDIEGSKKYIDKEVLKTIESGNAWWIGSYANFIKDYNQKNKEISPIKNTEKITGETATLKVKVTYTDNSTEEKTYDFVKQSGKWKITMNQ